jgi:hypothetical protein
VPIQIRDASQKVLHGKRGGNMCIERGPKAIRNGHGAAMLPPVNVPSVLVRILEGF